MGVIVKCQNVSEERLKEFQTLAETLFEQGYKNHILVGYIANRYRCPVSQTFDKDNNMILNLHTPKSI